MEQQELKLYTVDLKYIRNLQHKDDRVYSISPQIGKNDRPFLGIIIVCDEHKYCVPLSKPKEKHKRMRNQIDFKKIVVDDRIIGVLNFNLMIPVEEDQLRVIDTTIHAHDNRDTRRRKNRLQQELEWCNEHARDLENTANVLYSKYKSGDYFVAKDRCVDFQKLEKECEKYNSKKQKTE